MRSKYIKKSDIERLKKGASMEWWLPYQIMLETGLRVGDVAKIQYQDIEENNGKYYLHFTAEKTNKDGIAVLSDTLGKAIGRGRGYLFKGRKRGSHITRQALWARIKKKGRTVCDTVDGISPHSFRKSFAVDLMHAEGLEAVKEALQHSNDAVTRLYAYSDTIMSIDSDEPIRWRDVELLVDYILERLKESKNNTIGY